VRGTSLEQQISFLRDRKNLTNAEITEAFTRAGISMTSNNNNNNQPSQSQPIYRQEVHPSLMHPQQMIPQPYNQPQNIIPSGYTLKNVIIASLLAAGLGGATVLAANYMYNLAFSKKRNNSSRYIHY